MRLKALRNERHVGIHEGFIDRRGEKKKEKKKMGYVLRVRLASFFGGAAVASFMGLYILHNDYKVAHEAISHQVKGLHESLDRRISALESIKQTEAPQPAEAAE